jgi:hypothetical protein
MLKDMIKVIMIILNKKTLINNHQGRRNIGSLPITQDLTQQPGSMRTSRVRVRESKGPWQRQGVPGGGEPTC